MTARVSMLLKSRASLTCFGACFLPGRAKDLPTPRYLNFGHCLNTPKFYSVYYNLFRPSLGRPEDHKHFQ